MKQVNLFYFYFTRHCVYIKIHKKMEKKMKKKKKFQRGGFFLGLSMLSNLLKGGGVVKRKRRRRKNTKNKCKKMSFIE